MTARLPCCALVLLANAVWAGDAGPPEKAGTAAVKDGVAQEPTAATGMTIRSTISGGQIDADRSSAVIKDSSGTVIAIGMAGVAQIPYGTSKREVEKIASKLQLPLKKVSDTEWVIGLNTAHILFKNGKVAGEKLKLNF